MTTDSTQQLEQIVEPVCLAHGVELVQVARITERGGAVLRVLIDREGSEQGGGVTLADCQAVSRDLNTALDVHDPIGGKYRLEVSSPGVDRPLVKLRDYERFAGRDVKIKLKFARPDGRGGKQKSFSGKLIGVDGEMVRLESKGDELQLPFIEIARANVVHKFD